MAVKKSVKRTVSKTTSKAKKTAAKSKAVVKATPKPTGAITEKLRKSEIYSMIAEATSLSRKQVDSIFEQFNNLVERSVTKRGVGEFTLPNLCKIKVINKPATKARKGINPFTGEETTFKAKPARKVVKIRALKRLKEIAA